MTTVKFSELRSNHGNINKVIDIDNPSNSRSNAQIYDGTGKTVEIELSNFPEYLESLNGKPDTCIVLGVWPGSDDYEEYDITVEGKEKSEIGLIARTKKNFKFLNNDSISLVLLDFDGGYSRVQINEFLASLEHLFSDCLIGASASERRHMMRFEKPSCGGGVVIRGQRPEKWHIYIPVKNADSRLVKMIFQWAWLTKYPNHKINKGAAVEPRSIIDAAVGESNRICFESDPVVVCASEGIVELVERKCDYYPGGVLDCETALEVLEPIVACWQSAWYPYLQKIRNSPEFDEAVRAAEVRIEAREISTGTDPKLAKKRAKQLIKNQIITSSEKLTRTDGETVDVLKILMDRDSWIRTGYFTDHIDPVVGTNKGMILGNERNVFLNSKDHGGTKYFLRFDTEGIREWMKVADNDELIECFSSFIAQSVCVPEDIDVLMGEFKQRTKVTLGTVREAVKKKKKALEEDTTRLKLETEEGEVDRIFVPEDASQGMIINAYLRSLGLDMIRSYAGSLYVFDHTIWKKKSSGEISDELQLLFDHCSRNQRISDYTAMTKHILMEKPDISKIIWPITPGIPCATDFWKVSRNGIEKVKYTKDLGCRFKLGFNPDWEMSTPYWQKVLDNVRNPRCFQQGFGLALAGYLTSKKGKVLVLKGEGGSGKGTTNRVLTAMLPKGRVAHVGLEDMNKDTKLMSLVDAVINIIPEIKRGAKISTQGFKMVTGNDEMSAWKLYNGDVHFTSTASQVININDWPQFDSAGSELKRRLQDFICIFDRRQTDDMTELDEMIIENELPGVLAWAIDGIKDYFENGPDSTYSHEMFAEWTFSYDLMSVFVEDCISAAPNSACERTGLWEAFYNFCNGRPQVKQGEFYQGLNLLFGQAYKSGSVHKHKGIQLNTYGVTFIGGRGTNVSARRGKGQD